MLQITHPTITNHGGRSRLTANIVRDGVAHPLWFEIEEQFAYGLCADRCDAFVIGVLNYAMQFGHDIKCEAPVTDALHFQVTNHLIATLAKHNPVSRKDGIYPVSITAPLVPPSERQKMAVGAGISCGVDSLHVFARYTSSRWPSKNITHACVFNLHGLTNTDSFAQREAAFKDMQRRASAFCRENGFPLIIGNTNLDRGCLEHLQFDGSTTFANLFCILSLQNLFSAYHLASTYDMTTFWIDRGKWCDPSHYDPLIAAAVSNRCISIHVDGMADNRLDKVRSLASYLPARKNLNVCWQITPDHRNCSYNCPKCMRTMLNLDICGVLDDFGEVFDVAYFRRNYHEYLAEWYRTLLQRNPFALEMKPFLSSRHIPLLTKLRAWWIVGKKVILKVLRLGRTGHSFSPR